MTMLTTKLRHGAVFLGRLIRVSLVAVAIWVGLLVGQALSGTWDSVGALIYAPAFVLAGWASAYEWIRRYPPDPKVVVGVGCGACGWRQELDGPEQALPAMRHHVEFVCPAAHDEGAEL